MKHKTALVISVLAVISPILSIAIMQFLESESLEAVLSGLLIGCIIGSALGIASLVISKGKYKLINALAIIPMCPLVLYLLLLIPYLTYSFS